MVTYWRLTLKGVDPNIREMRFAGWKLELGSRRLVNPEGTEVMLTHGEYDLLLALLSRANSVVSRDKLMRLVSGRKAGPFCRAIDVAIGRLRRRLDDDPTAAQLIKTVRGKGYAMMIAVDAR